MFLIDATKPNVEKKFKIYLFLTLIINITKYKGKSVDSLHKN